MVKLFWWNWLTFLLAQRTMLLLTSQHFLVLYWSGWLSSLFPRNLRIFCEQLFWRTSTNDCFWTFKDYIRDGTMEDIFSLSFPAAIDFYTWVQLGIDVHTHHQKYHVRPHSLWFSCACAAGIAQRNYLFLLSKQNCSSVSKIKFKQTADCYQRCC